MKNTMKGNAKLSGRGGGGGANKVMIMGDVQVTNPAILTEQTWSIKDLF